MDTSDYERQIAKLEQKNRILKQKLSRNEEKMVMLEELLETHSNALKVRNAELEESHKLIRISEIKYRELAHHDTLTGLPNRASFHEKLTWLLDHGRDSETYIALLFIDLDRFKLINDNLGHKAGDTALKLTAKRLLSCVRGNDAVFRLGGDEFAMIVLDNASFDLAEMLAKRINEVISKPLVIEGQTFNMGVSIGISMYPYDDTDHDKLLQKADYAMYYAKKAQNPHYAFYRDVK